MEGVEVWEGGIQYRDIIARSDIASHDWSRLRIATGRNRADHQRLSDPPLCSIM